MPNAEAFNEAERLDLRAEVLYPLEVPAFQRLKVALKQDDVSCGRSGRGLGSGLDLGLGSGLDL